MSVLLHRNHHPLNHHLLHYIRHYSRISPPKPSGPDPVIRVVNNVAHLGSPKDGPKPRQLLSLPPFPSQPLPARCLTKCLNEKKNQRVTAISWVKYYFDEVLDHVIQYHFTKGLVQVECSGVKDSSSQGQESSAMRKIKHNEVMKAGARIYVPVSIAESRISRRFDHIPTGTLYPNADEIAYLQRLVMYKDSAIIVLNKPPKLPLKGNLPIHNSMDALAAAALSYDNEEGPRLVHRLDRESSGILLMGRTKQSASYLHQLFGNTNEARTSCLDSNDAREATCMRYWALVIGSPKEKEGYICAPLTKVLLDDGKTERVMLAHSCGLEASQEAITEYRVLGPMINGCSWVELRPHTSRKHQLRVHCAEALGTPIVGDYKYGWFVHRKWKQTPQVNIEPTSGKPYKLRRPDGLDIQKGSVLSKVPLLHLTCRELVLPNIAKFLKISEHKSTDYGRKLSEKPDVLRFVASMPSHMKISWNLMSSYLV
ncbi:RNA pseudouridine synthase 3, mitochondrial [Silene latifolia]|uniref:RNA pseudouridine synthase 3, mitochondrial n=1 Tax=Silene latifolia TaxID=37657 RepID=UPI003D771A4D